MPYIVRYLPVPSHPEHSSWAGHGHGLNGTEPWANDSQWPLTRDKARRYASKRHAECCVTRMLRHIPERSKFIIEYVEE